MEMDFKTPKQVFEFVEKKASEIVAGECPPMQKPNEVRSDEVI